MSASLQAGITVNEQWTTSYNNGTTQTESRLIVPTVQFSGVTTTRNMSLPAGAGRERVIEVVTTAANTTDIDTTTTLPDGSVQSSNESLIQTGNKTTFNKTTHLPGDGGFELIQGQTIANGTTSTTDETIHSPDGTVSQDHIVVTHRGPVEITDETLSAPHAPAGHIHTVVVHHGELNQTRTTTTTQPGTARQVVKSTTVVFRLPPN